MATTTTRLGLRKPAGADNVNVTTDISDSMDKIDTAATMESLTSFPVAPFTGKTIQRSDLNNQPYFYTGSIWVPIAFNRQFVRKVADETVNNSAAFQSDDELTLPVLNAGIYHGRLCLIYESNAAQDIKYQWLVPGASTGRRQAYGPSLAAATADPVAVQTVVSTSFTSANYTFGGIGATHTSLWEDFIITAGAAGNITLQWAQNTAAANNTVVHSESFFELWRVG